MLGEQTEKAFQNLTVALVNFCEASTLSQWPYPAPKMRAEPCDIQRRSAITLHARYFNGPAVTLSVRFVWPFLRDRPMLVSVAVQRFPENAASGPHVTWMKKKVVDQSLLTTLSAVPKSFKRTVTYCPIWGPCLSVVCFRANPLWLWSATFKSNSFHWKTGSSWATSDKVKVMQIHLLPVCSLKC